MIGPEEIKSQAEKWWKPFLQSHLSGGQFFPRTIDRIGKITASSVRNNINELQDQLASLRSRSKEVLGHGYTIDYGNVNFRRTGAHSLPQSIQFSGADDYIDYLARRDQWEAFLKNADLVSTSLPELKEWVFNNPVCLIEYDGHWEGLIKVCQYFIHNPRPDLYLRQLPIDVHTKFIEQHSAIVSELLDQIIGDHRRDPTARIVSNRYHLKSDEPSVRIRILDESLQIGGLSDVTIPRSDFERIHIPCKNVVITENKMNFLSLPALPSSIAIWSGGGFMINYLRDVQWLHERKIFYWGDLDVHGFAILHQMRSYFPQTESIMMDLTTFDLFRGEGLVEGKPIKVENLGLLTTTEAEMFYYLKTNNYRLEQEKIRQGYVDGVLEMKIS
jgi:hypothetical protein